MKECRDIRKRILLIECILCLILSGIIYHSGNKNIFLGSLSFSQSTFVPLLLENDVGEEDLDNPEANMPDEDNNETPEVPDESDNNDDLSTEGDSNESDGEYDDDLGDGIFDDDDLVDDLGGETFDDDDLVDDLEDNPETGEFSIILVVGFIAISLIILIIYQQKLKKMNEI